MAFVEDLNYDDEDLTNFPQLDPGQTFQKGWRLRNTGTCTWNSTYFLQYTHGNDPAAQMGGQPTAIRGAVEPGQTYDIYVDLVAPDDAGKYVGYWQLHNSQNQAFGQTVWVAVQVGGTAPGEPTATVTPPPSPTVTEVPPDVTETVTVTITVTVAPGEPTEEPGSDLWDITWRLTGYLADITDDSLTEPIEEDEVNVIFREDGSVEGSAGCNTFTGFYVTNGVELVLEEISTTGIDCDQPAGIMEQEAAFLELLENADKYRLNSAGQLEIIREVVEDDQPVDKVILLFTDSTTQ
jgi:heat shock protein HslJ